MSLHAKAIILGAVFVCLTAANSYSQEKSNTPAKSNTDDSSLGDIARQMRAQKAKETKPSRVITTDTIAQPGDDTAAFGASAKEKSSTEPTPAPSEARPAAHDEMYFRSHWSSLQGKLDIHKRELEVLQQKLGQNQMQYYPDPNKTLHQEYSRADIDKLTAEIDAKKQQIADDETAIQDLRDQLRHEGGDPGWLR